MNDYLFLMHDDASATENAAWESYFAMLRASGRFNGGSSIGKGECVILGGASPRPVSPLSGYLRVEANSLEEAKTLLVGNPVLIAGGTVEIRELPRGR